VLAVLLSDGSPVCLPHECLDGAPANAAADTLLLGHPGSARSHRGRQIAQPGKSPRPAARQRVWQRIP